MWSRRRFLEAATASAALTVSPSGALFCQEPQPRSQRDSPEITTGHYAPLLRENVARPIRYSPQDGAIVIRNGNEFFNRPLYGPNIPFRADGGDLPEFSLYLPGHGGNVRLGVASQQSARSKWFFEFESVIAFYDAGCLSYALRDSLLGHAGAIHLQVLTVGAALWLQVTSSEILRDLELIWAFGGVSGRKGKRNGDIGCESEPVSAFFQMRPEECRGNIWTMSQGPEMARASAEVRSGKFRIAIDSAPGSTLKIGAAEQWNHGWTALWDSSSDATGLPLLLGRVGLGAQPEIIRITALEGVVLPAPPPGTSMPSPNPEASASGLVEVFAQRRDELRQTAGRLSWTTPDAYLNGVAAALGIAADAIWDEQQGCVMHGAVAWRQPLAGWRGPYVLDVVGHHDRMRRHLRHWIARQNVAPVENGSSGDATADGFAQITEAKGAPDAGSHGSRSERLLHSAGDISHNHYDMNLVFFDALLRHLDWTGDVDFAREAWPALERHAAWERRLFRRDYGDATEPLPLYEAYAAIWASDNLQYNGGGAAHTSAYNLYLNQRMARLSKRLNLAPETSASYQSEADAISRAMRKQLWMEGRGAFAESREWLGERKLAENPAVWTMYQALDSEACNRKEAWQIASDRLRSLRKIPVIGEGVPEDAGWQVACSDWQPYVWSLTLLVLAENLATALGLFQAGLAREGYALLRGSLLDAGYRGLCPGNFPMSLQLDPHRQESQRDFGDPIGCASRAIVEGLWGLRPDLLSGRLRLSPQLPREWNEATLRHSEVIVEYHLHGRTEVWNVKPSFGKDITLSLELVVRTARLPKAKVNGHAQSVRFVDGAVGAPRVVIETEQPGPWNVELLWEGDASLPPSSEPLRLTCGHPIVWPPGIQHHQIDDPQHCLTNGIPSVPGRHCIFALQRMEDAEYWLPIELSIAEPAATPSRERRSSQNFEPIELEHLFSGSVTDILTRDYHQPRSPFCSLNLPDTLLGGWANFDVTAKIDDVGLRGSGGQIKLPSGVLFRTPSSRSAPNCCYISQWAIDPKQVKIDLAGKGRKLHLLLAGTTFPQATGSTHATLSVAYRDAQPATIMALRSPQSWWPIEQDYPVDDYIFLLGGNEDPLPWRVDLSTAKGRKLIRESLRGKGGPIRGGAAFTVEMDLDPDRELATCTLHCELYGVVLGLLAMTLERS